MLHHLACLLACLPAVRAGPDPEYQFSFKMPERFGELDSGSGDCCEYGGIPLPVGYAQQVPSILGLGVHKSGTTFLFHLLALHPDVVEPANSLKELYMFAEWPLGFGAFDNYLKTWDVDQGQAAPGQHLFEATATYLHVAGAPCRMKALLPDAKFVVVLRDPVARALSHYNMAVQLFQQGKRGNHPGTFQEVLAKSFAKLEGPGCFFDGTDPEPRSWNECYKCWYVVLDEALRRDVCEAHGLDYRSTHEGAHVDTPCNPLVRSGMFVQFGTYAAPIAWWLHFFTPDHFVFLNNDELDWATPEEGAALGNRLARALGLAEVYTAELMAQLPAMDNHFNYSAIDPLAEDIVQAKAQLRKYYHPQVRDLYKLFEHIGVDFPPFKEWPYQEVMQGVASA